MAPTLGTFVSFSTVLSFSGLTSCDLGSKGYQVIQRTTAVALQISNDEVDITQCAVDNRRLLDMIMERRLQTRGISVTADILLALANYGNPDPQSFYSKLVQNLNSSVSSGEYSRELLKQSIELGVNNFENATILQYIATPLVVIRSPGFAFPSRAPTEDPLASSNVTKSASEDTTLGAPELSGVVIGSVVGLLLLVFLVYRVCQALKDRDHDHINFDDIPTFPGYPADKDEFAYEHESTSDEPQSPGIYARDNDFEVTIDAIHAGSETSEDSGIRDWDDRWAYQEFRRTNI